MRALRRLPGGFGRTLFCLLAVWPVVSQAQIITTIAGGKSLDGATAVESKSLAMRTIAVARISDTDFYFSTIDGVIYKSTAGTISIYAGSETGGGSGAENVPRLNARISAENLLLAPDGTLYFSDGFAQIRKITPGGLVQTVAGTGVEGDTGDGGSALAAQLYRPGKMALLPNGNLLFCQEQKHKVRMVTPGGIISTFAGTGIAGSGGNGNYATDVRLTLPSALAVDTDGNVYIADSGNFNIRRVRTDGVILPHLTSPINFAPAVPDDSLIGLYGAYLYLITDLAFAANGDLIISERGNNRILRYRANGGTRRLAGNGSDNAPFDVLPAKSAPLQATSISTLPGGDVLMAAGNRILRLNTTAETVSLVHGNSRSSSDGLTGPLSAQLFLNPGSLRLQGNGLYWTELEDCIARRLDFSNPTISIVAGLAGQCTASALPGTVGTTSLSNPASLAFDATGNLYASAFERIVRITTGGQVSAVAGNGTLGYSGDGGLATDAAICAGGLSRNERDSLGNYYFYDCLGRRIRKITPAGNITTVAGNGVTGFGPENSIATNQPIGSIQSLRVDSQGNLWFSEQVSAAGPPSTTRSRLRKLTVATGRVNTVAGNGVAYGFDSNGAYLGFSGDGGPALQAAIYFGDFAFGPDGSIYVADRLNDRIRKIDANNIVSTIAGNGSGVDTGDGGNALAAGLWAPGNIEIDASGNVYVANHRRIRRFSLPLPAAPLVSGQISFTKSGYAVNRATGQVTQTITVKNNGGNIDNLRLALTDLTNTTLLNATGVVNGPNWPYVAAGSLAAGATVQVALTFSPVNPNAIYYSNILFYAGGVL